MKRPICLALFLLLLCAGCVPPSLSATAAPTFSPAPPLSPAPTATLSSTAPVPRATETAVPPPENRRYYDADGRHCILSGSVTEQELDAIVVTLRLGAWKSLATVLDAYGISMMDAPANGVRKYDLTRGDEYGNVPEYRIDMPVYDTESGVAYIELSTYYYQGGTSYLILFHKAEEGGYSALSVVTLREDYYAESPTFRFETLGNATYLIWNGLTARGTGFVDHGERWYDTGSGLCVYGYSTHGYDAEWEPRRFDMEAWETTVSYKAVPVSDAGGFYLTAHERETFSPTGAEKVVYECDYNIYYDEKLGEFYTAYDALLPIYQDAANSSYEEIREWAARQIPYIDELREKNAKLLTDESKRMKLENKQTQIEILPIYGRRLTLERLFALCINLNAAEAGGYADLERLFTVNGIGVSYGAEDDPLRATFEGISDVSCSLDMDTCMERTIFLNMSFSKDGQRRGFTFVYRVAEQTDTADLWELASGLRYPLTDEYGAVEALWPGAALSYGLKVPAGEANGHPLYRSIVFTQFQMRRGLSFISEYYDAQGVRHTLDFSDAPTNCLKGIAGKLLVTRYDAGAGGADYEPYAEVYSDYEWEQGAAFTDEGGYATVKEFFEWDPAGSAIA